MGWRELDKIVGFSTTSAVSSIIGTVASFAVVYLLKRAHDGRSRRIARTRRPWLIRLAQEGLTSDLLRRFYTPERLRNGNLQLYSFALDGAVIQEAIATRPEWLQLSVDIGDVIGDVVDQTPFDLGPTPANVPWRYRRALGNALTGAAFRMWDDPLYRLIGYDIGVKQLSLTLGKDTFFNYRKRAGLIIDESREALLKTRLETKETLVRRSEILKLREIILPDGASLANTGLRLTAGGICALLAVARGHPHDDYVLFIMRRTGEVAGNQGLLSLSPEGLHAPHGEMDRDASVQQSLYRELCEELFGTKEAERTGDPMVADGTDFCPAASWLAEHPESTTIEVTCFGFELIGGNYELGILIAAHDPQFWNTFGDKTERNWEVKVDSRPSSYNSDVLTKLLQRPDWNPSGRFVLIEALRRLHACARPPHRVSLPPIVVLTDNENGHPRA